MDYKKKVTLYSVILGVLVITAALGIIFDSRATTARQSQEPLLAGYDSAKITAFSVEGQATIAKKGQNAWQVLVDNHAYPPDSEKIDTFLKGLGKLTKERQAASSGNLAPFGLNTPKRLQLRDSAGKVLYDLLVGKTDDAGKGVYVKEKDKNEVWLTSRDELASLDLSFDTWADTHLIIEHLKSEDLTRISFNGKLDLPPSDPKDPKTAKSYGSFDLVKELKNGKPAWKLAANNSFPEAAQGYLDGLVELRVNSYMKPSEAFDQTKIVGTLTLETQKGSRIELLLGQPGADKKIPAHEGNRDFWLSDWSLEQVLFK